MTTNQEQSCLMGRQRRIFFLASILLVLILVAVVLFKEHQEYSSIPVKLDTFMAYQVVNAYPHDPDAFTQGLVLLDGFLYESTGLYGESTLRQVALETGEVIQEVSIASDYFGEGLTDWEGTLVQLTWREGVGFVYDVVDFSLMRIFNYPNEGWGLTNDGEQLIMSDGSSTLYFLDPETFQIVDTVSVTYHGEEINHLNELEFIRGEIYANILKTDDIVRINPDTGQVKGWIDVSGIFPEGSRTSTNDVLNGIAYDPIKDRLFITGKRWSFLYEIRLIPVPDGE